VVPLSQAQKKGTTKKAASKGAAPPAKRGRPKKEIDLEQLEKLAMMQCTYDEIAAWFDVDKSTISRNFATEIAKGREKGKMSLRRKQFNLADTSAAMAIFLGKNYLNQKDQPDTDEKPDRIKGTEYVVS
jgi:hypothetical protein